MKRYLSRRMFMPPLVSLVSGIFLFLSFPDANAYFLAWIALAPLIFILPLLDLKRAFACGLLAGLVAYSAVFYWIFHLIRFNTGSWVQALICLGLLSLYMALYIALWMVSLKFAEKSANDYWLALFAASGWVALEYLRTYFLTGFPWALLGYSQWQFTPLIQIAEYTGVYGVSFILVLSSVLAARFIAKGNWRVASLGVLGLAAVVLWGQSLFPKVTRDTENPPVTVAVIQANIDQYKKWDKAYEKEILGTYSSLVRRAASEKPDIIIWPETAVPGYLPADPYFSSWVAETVRETGTYNLIGSPYFDGGNKYYNATFLFSPDGRIAGVHKKTHLVPFGEYVPLRSVLDRYFGVLSQLGDFERGELPSVVTAGKVTVGPSICSENFFSTESRHAVLRGAGMLTNQTNDAWFFRTSAPYQHFIMNVFRAIENRRPVVVCGNTGLSGIVDPSGRVRHTIPIFSTDYFVAEVHPSRTLTFYSKNGDVFAKICIIVAVSCFVFFLVRRYLFSAERRERSGAPTLASEQPFS